MASHSRSGLSSIVSRDEMLGDLDRAEDGVVEMLEKEELLE